MTSLETQAISFCIKADKLDALERLAQATDRPRSWHIERALDAYLELQSWQVAEIERAIAEIDAGRGIPHEEVERELLSWGKAENTKRRR